MNATNVIALTDLVQAVTLLLDRHKGTVLTFTVIFGGLAVLMYH